MTKEAKNTTGNHIRYLVIFLSVLIMFGIDHIVIVGCGLIGGSFGLAMRRAGFAGKITVCGGSRASVAVDRGVADALEESFSSGQTCQADLIYLAAPIGGIINFLRTHSSGLKEGAIVTDVGSTKSEILRVAGEALSPKVHFIGGHPMAGSENTGVEYARADLFERANYVLIAAQSTPEEALSRMISIVEALGAKPVITDAESHDLSAAMISHLPQLVSSALASLLGPEQSDRNFERALAQRLAATGWRDMTRLGGSSWNVWRDICMTNRGNIAGAMDLLIAELQSIKDALDAGDFNLLRDLFEEANRSVREQREIHYSRFESLKSK